MLNDEHRVLVRAFDAGHFAQFTVLLIAHEQADELVRIPALVAAVNEMARRCVDIAADKDARALWVVEVIELDQRVTPLLVQLVEEEGHALALDVDEQ